MVAVLCTANMIAQDVKGDVIIHTDMGDIVVVLYDETPKHKENFLKLAGEGFYTDLLFHRVIEGFMIQGGDPDSKNAKPGVQLGSGAVDYLIDAEFNPNLFHKKGALAAARQGDHVNPKKASSGCQFYIVQGNVLTDAHIQMYQQRYGLNFTPEQIEAYKTVGGTPHLDGEYTVFGEVVEGMDVIDKIANVKTGYMDVPVEAVTMTVEIIKN